MYLTVDCAPPLAPGGTAGTPEAATDATDGPQFLLEGAVASEDALSPGVESPATSAARFWGVAEDADIGPGLAYNNKTKILNNIFHL